MSNKSKHTLLVTGGTGYIGSHTCIELIQSGFDIVVIDNLSNSSHESLHRIEQITGKAIEFHEADVRDEQVLSKIFKDRDVIGIIHFAGLKAVGESNEKPLEYYENNVAGSITLAKVAQNCGVSNLIFSSSATVYGDPASIPIKETAPTSTTNPYGQSKLIVENIYRDLCKSPANNFRITLLRYFNPIGAHESGTIGEDPKGIPNNLLPYITQVAVGLLPKLSIFGDDYPTPDGTGTRDYIHVVDLARAHVQALKHQLKNPPGCYTFNVGTGSGYSVLEIVKAFEEVSGIKIPYEITARRPGDIAACYADTALAKSELGWVALYGLKRMLEDSWRWQQQNPKGYNS